MNFNSNQNDQINQSESILPSSNTNADLLCHLKQKQQQHLTIVPIEKEAPSEDKWYHGRLERRRAELVLREHGKPGAFLVRESEKSSGSYVLSYLSLTSIIHHFKITAVLADFYIGGRQFDKLDTLISYYMHYSELVKDEKLLEPVAPSRVCHLQKFCVSIKTFQRPNKIDFDLIKNLDPMNEEDDILYIEKQGELFRVYSEMADGEWMWAQACQSNECGLLKADCVTYVDDDKIHQFEPWFYSDITKEEAVSILANSGNLSYLVRPSEQSSGDFTLFFLADNSVHRFRITGCQAGSVKYFHIGGRDYTSISAIVQRYMNEDITEGYRLSKVAHKRADIHPLEHLSVIKDKTNQSSFRMSLNRNISFANKIDMVKKHNSFVYDENMLAKNSQSYLNGLSMSLNESSLKSAISITNPGQQSNKMFSFRQSRSKMSDKNQIRSQASINEPNLEIKSSIMSKSFSSPLTFSNLNRNDFYPDTLLKAFSSSSSSFNKSNEPSQSNSSNSSNQQNMDTDNFNRKKKIVLKGYLSKYIEKSKKWKPYWFSLNQTDQQLFFFSDEKKVKEKGLIDLSYGFYYPLDDSFFNRSHCFQIVIHSLGSGQSINGTSSPMVHYLCAENLKSFKEWTEHIRPLCNPIQYNPFVCRPLMSSSSSSLSLSSSSSSSSPLNTSRTEQNYRILRTLNVDIHEARNVCFSTKLKAAKPTEASNGQLLNPCVNNSVVTCSHGASPPKYHKDNMYYCLVMFNSEAIVASTRLATCHNPAAATTTEDAIWDDSFTFDNLPLDVKELKICLLVLAKPSNFSSSLVNNLKKLNNSGKVCEPMLLGCVSVRLDELINRGQCESWYAVEPVVHSDSKAEYEPTKCSIRIKVRFCEEKIFLNKNHYKLLSAYLLDEREHKNMSILYEQVIPSTERSHFVQALLRLFIVKNKLIDMLKSFLQTDIDRCSDLSTLFRPATCSTSLMDQYMRVRCENFLHKVVEEPLVRIFKQGGKSFELDPAKCPDAAQREQNLFNFQVALKDLINSICNQNSVDLFPNELKHIFYLIKQNVHLKWIEQGNTASDDKLIRVYCVSAFVFLRLLCPALLNPKNFGLKFSTGRSLLYTAKSSHFDYYDIANQFAVFSPTFMFTLSPSPSSLIAYSSSNLSLFNQSSHQVNCFNVSSLLAGSGSSASAPSVQSGSYSDRHIKLLAKVLQTLANMTECKEPFMMPLSDFLSANKPNIIKFIEDISSVSEFEVDHLDLSDLEDEADDSSEHESLTDRRFEVKAQFENASCKYLAILNRLLHSFIPQMRSYVQTLDAETDEASQLGRSIHRLIHILNDINK